MPDPLGASLEFKPDFEDAKQRWLAFWNHEIIDRPCCCIRAPKDGVQPPPGPPYLAGSHGDFAPVIERILESAAAWRWAGEAMPSYTPSFGPDMLAAWLGAELRFDERGYGTSWAEPCVEEWADWLPITLRTDSHWWRRMVDFCEALGSALEGKMLVAHLDLHSNADALSAMRLPAQLCLDMLDSPELIDRAMRDVRALYAPIYEALYDAARMANHGTTGWVNAYHPVRTNTIQCDFAALIGPDQFRRFVVPALEEEAAYLGHCVYHLDGPECIVHLDNLCAIPGLDCIQWVHGARNKEFIEWMDLLRGIQSRGVAVWIPCNTEQLRVFHRELRPELLYYDCWAASEREADETLQWLTRNT